MSSPAQPPDPEWPVNPAFPNEFEFPAFDTPEWYPLAFGGPSHVNATGEKDNWQERWRRIHRANARAAECCGRSYPDITDYSFKRLGHWVETLLSNQRFSEDVNGWALHWTLKEFRQLRPAELRQTDWHIWQPERAEHLCRRFYDYQRARYRYHTHLLQKRCERASGKLGLRNPARNRAEARACLIGWLSRQPGFSKHPLVTAFRQAIKRKSKPLPLHLKTAFQAERQHPSKRPSHAQPDEVGWLILTWPVWNYYGWRFADIAFAIRLRFRAVGAKGKRFTLTESDLQEIEESIRKSDAAEQPAPPSIPELVERFRTEDQRRWRRMQRRQSDDRTIEQLCRRQVGLPIEPRPRGRRPPGDPQLWHFALSIFST